MNAISPSRLFITGTDTGVGKTHVTCLIARQLISSGLRVAAYKPVCSGAILSTDGSSRESSNDSPRWDDIERLSEATDGHWPQDWICPQRFLAPLAPPIAARLEGTSVDFQKMVDGAVRFAEADCLLVEGAGGWLSPLTETHSVADLALVLQTPVLIVSRPGLGTINQTLLTIESVRARGLSVVGVVLNEATLPGDDPSVTSNPDEIEARSGVAVFGTVHYGKGSQLHRDGKLVTINWYQLISNVPGCAPSRAG